MFTTYKQAHTQRLADDRLYFLIIYFLMALLLIITVYPLIYIISSSFSSASAVLSGRVILWPVDSALKVSGGFQKSRCSNWICNSSIYTVLGTLVNISMTLLQLTRFHAVICPLPNSYSLHHVTCFLMGVNSKLHPDEKPPFAG